VQSIRSVAIVDPTGSKPTIVGGSDAGALHFVDVHSRTGTVTDAGVSVTLMMLQR
jgi:hypothetical protein